MFVEDVCVHTVAPLSKPGLPNNCAAVHPPDGVVTVNVYVAVCTAGVEPLLPVPVMVIGYVPAATADVVAIVAVDDPPAVTEDGANVTVTPVGAPLAANDTDCADPEVTAVLTVAAVVAPGATEPDVGLVLIEKSLVTGGVTVNVNVVLWVTAGEPEPVPVTVIA